MRLYYLRVVACSMYYEREKDFFKTTIDLSPARYVTQQGTTDTVKASCPAGYSLLGGGCEDEVTPHKFQYSKPAGDGKAWECGGPAGTLYTSLGAGTCVDSLSNKISSPNYSWIGKTPGSTSECRAKCDADAECRGYIQSGTQSGVGGSANCMKFKKQPAKTKDFSDGWEKSICYAKQVQKKRAWAICWPVPTGTPAHPRTPPGARESTDSRAPGGVLYRDYVLQLRLSTNETQFLLLCIFWQSTIFSPPARSVFLYSSILFLFSATALGARGPCWPMSSHRFTSTVPQDVQFANAHRRVQLMPRCLG